jgi:predicted MPP superfamily phosphohydrolase
VRRLSIVLAMLVGMHLFVWWRLVHGQAWELPGTLLVALGCPSLPIGGLYVRRLPRATARPILIAIYTWFGLVVYLILAAVASFFVDARWAVLGAIGVVALGMLNVRRLVVRRVRVPLLDRPYRIAQLTDVHIGPTLGRAFAEKVAARVNALDADLVVLTGDIVDWRLEELREHVAPLGTLRAKDGVYMVTGNHEYYWNAEAWMAHLASLGLRVLRNQRQAMRGFDLVGVDDSTAGEDVDAAIEGATQPVVLLAHHPSTIRRSAGKVFLQLSGHTHGGQLLPLGWLSRLFEPHTAGLARFASTWLYVSEGTGFWGPPLRVGTSCEIAVIELGSAP